jgi:hypothetical protein
MRTAQGGRKGEEGPATTTRDHDSTRTDGLSRRAPGSDLALASHAHSAKQPLIDVACESSTYLALQHVANCVFGGGSVFPLSRVRRLPRRLRLPSSSFLSSSLPEAPSLLLTARRSSRASFRARLASFPSLPPFPSFPSFRSCLPPPSEPPALGAESIALSANGGGPVGAPNGTPNPTLPAVAAAAAAATIAAFLAFTAAKSALSSPPP